jgi:hypothetical protein
MGTFLTLLVGFGLGAAFVVVLAVRASKRRAPAARATPDTTQARLTAALQALDTIARNGEGPLAAIARRAIEKDRTLHTRFTG